MRLKSSSRKYSRKSKESRLNIIIKDKELIDFTNKLKHELNAKTYVEIFRKLAFIEKMLNSINLSLAELFKLCEYVYESTQRIEYKIDNVNTRVNVISQTLIDILSVIKSMNEKIEKNTEIINEIKSKVENYDKNIQHQNEKQQQQPTVTTVKNEKTMIREKYKSIKIQSYVNELKEHINALENMYTNILNNKRQYGKPLYTICYESFKKVKEKVFKFIERVKREGLVDYLPYDMMDTVQTLINNIEIECSEEKR